MLSYRFENNGSLVQVYPLDERSYIALLDILTYLGFHWLEGQKPNTWIPERLGYLTLNTTEKWLRYTYDNAKLFLEQTVPLLESLGFIKGTRRQYENPAFESFILLDECQLKSISALMKDFRSLAETSPQISFDENTLGDLLESETMVV